MVKSCLALLLKHNSNVARKNSIFVINDVLRQIGAVNYSSNTTVTYAASDYSWYKKSRC